MKPIIGITPNYLKSSKFGIDAHIGCEGQYWQALADDYVTSITRAGGIPVILPILASSEDAAAYIERLDGLLVTGGNDVSPLLYGERTNSTVGEICEERDEMEMALFREALNTPGFPVMGICRGAQLMNVALGGTMVVDIDTEKYGEHFLFPDQRMDVVTHTVILEEGSVIEKLMGQERRVNSFHHQAVGIPGDGVVITATDENGMPECIEVPDRIGFTLGLQWHPEGLAAKYQAHQNLFRGFVEAAEEYRKK